VESSLKRAGIQIKECIVPIHHYGKLTTKNIISKGEDYYFLGKIKLDKKGDDIQALFELAVQAMELKKYDEAIELWQKFLNLKTDIPKAFLTVAYVFVGSAYLRLGKYTDALLFSEKAIELTPDLKEAAVNYAFSAFYVGDVKKVISVLENLLSNVPEYLPAEILLSSAYCIAGSKEKGIEYLKDIKKKGINCARYLYEYAKILFSLKKVEQAMLLIDAAVESDCLNKDILNLLSECYKQKTN
jgi:tetratricopeptide (TPR) repeat protein